MLAIDHDQELFLRGVLVGCEYLERVITSSFGPLGSLKVLATATGKIRICGSVNSLFKSFNTTHPAVRVILDSAQRLSEQTGDSTAAFLIAFTAALREVLRCESHSAILSRQIGHFVAVTAPLLLEKMKGELAVRVSVDDGASLARAVLNMAFAMLITSTTNNVARVLANLVTQFVFLHSSRLEQLENNIDYAKRVQLLSRYFNQTLVALPWGSVSDSHILEGCLLQFSKSCTSMPAIRLGNCKYVIFNGDLFARRYAECQDEGGSSIFVAGQNLQGISSHILLEKEAEFASEFARYLRHQCNVGLIIVMEEGINSKQVLSELAANGISVLESVDTGSVDRLCKWQSLSPLIELPHIGDALPEDCIGTLASVHEVSTPSRTYAHIKPLVLNAGCTPLYSHTVVICSPTQELCSEYINALKRVVAMLANFAEEVSSGALAFVPGGCAAELFIAKHISELKCDPSRSLAEREVLSVLHAGMMALPTALLKSSMSSDRRVFDILQDLQQKRLTNSNYGLVSTIHSPLHGTQSSSNMAPLSFGDELLVIADCTRYGIIEPLFSKFRFVLAVAETLQQILRIHKIVPAKRLTQQHQHM